MSKYAVFDADGLPTAFYADDVHAEIPDGAVAITDDQWQEFLSNQGLRKWDNGAVVAYTPPPPSNDVLMAAVRSRRDGLLAASDWTQVADSPLGTDIRASWSTYRQALRDLPEKASDPANVTWPGPPR